MPYKDKRNKVSPWIGQKREGEKKIRKSFRTRKEADTWERMVEISQTSTGMVCLIEWMNDYLDFAKQQFVKKTYDEKVLAFKTLLQHNGVVGHMPVDALKPKTILSYLQSQEMVRSGNAANKDRKNLRAAWQWGVTYLDMPAENPFGIVAKRGETRTPRHVPSLDDFWKVYRAAETDQDKCMLICYLHTGARRDELFRMRWVDVDFLGQRIRLFWRKNRLGTWKDQWVDMSDDMMSALIDHRRGNVDGDFVFTVDGRIPYQYRNRWLNGICDKVGVKRFGFHGIRHLTASLLAEKGIPMVEIQNHLRHDHLSTTERYIHRIRKNRIAIEALPGLISTSETSSPYMARIENSDAIEQSLN